MGDEHATDDGGRWWHRGMRQLYSAFKEYRKARRSKNGGEDSDPGEDAFIENVCTHQPISYSLFGFCIQGYIVYVALCRAASLCLFLDGSDTLLGALSALLFPRNLSLRSLVATCASNPPTLYSLCQKLLFWFYFTVLCVRVVDLVLHFATVYSRGYEGIRSRVRAFDRGLFAHVLPVINGAVVLPLVLIPGSRTKFTPLAEATSATTAMVGTVWNLYGLLSWLPSLSMFAFLSPAPPASKLIVPGLTPGTRGPSFWGSWVFGGPYSGAILLWWLFQLCNRHAVGFYAWEVDQTVATVDEVVTGVNEPMEDDHDGRMGGGRVVGWCRRMWTRFSGILVFYLWQLVKYAHGSLGLTTHSNGGGGRYFVEWDVDLSFPGLLWMWLGVAGSGVALGVWTNFLNYQHRLVVWKDKERRVGVVIDEEDDELKVGMVY